MSRTPAHGYVGNSAKLFVTKAVALAFDTRLMTPDAGVLISQKLEDFPDDFQGIAFPNAVALFSRDIGCGPDN
jgi:hypothetical protein